MENYGIIIDAAFNISYAGYPRVRPTACSGRIRPSILIASPSRTIFAGMGYF